MRIIIFLLTFAPSAWSALQVHTNFPGGAMELRKLEPSTQTITFAPANFRNRGWACWWHFKLTGVDTNRPVTLRLQSKSSFGRPGRAMFSYDGRTWKHTRPQKNFVYVHRSLHDTIHFAWGPPFQLADSRQLVDWAAKQNAGAEAFELCRSNEKRSVPALRWNPGKARRGAWIQARQHAWESGSSWVCRGFVEWLCSGDQLAVRLRTTTRLVVVPIMDADNVERGAGGKNQLPHDHNRDWSAKPVWAEVAAAQKGIRTLNDAGAFDLFIDLHNPAPGDHVPFFFAPPKTHLPPVRTKNQQRFHELCLETLGREPLKFSERLRISGPGYHPLWRAISKNWVAENTADHAVALTLETAWNTPNSTQEGYLNYGRAFGRAVGRYLLGE